MLQNKEGLWISDEEWNFITKDDLVYVENISKAKVLVTTNEGEVVLEDFEEDKKELLWKKGEPNDEGYFTLENTEVSKVMTATSSTSLELEAEGNTFF